MLVEDETLSQYDHDGVERQQLLATDSSCHLPVPSSKREDVLSMDIDVNCDDKDRSNKISEWEAGASIAKAIMGAGSFALPWAFSKMGLIAGMIAISILMFLSVHSIKLLVKCSRAYEHTCIDGSSSSNNIASSSSKRVGCGSYVDVARASFGNTGARLSYFASISASVGVCGSYLVFIAANLRSLLQLSMVSFSVSQGTLVLIVLPLAILLSSVRDVKRFAFTALLGNISVVAGMMVVVIYGFLYHAENIGEGCIVTMGSLDTMALSFGAVGYLFLVHFLIIPVESSMARPEKFDDVATTSFLACTIISGIFGVVGYLFFGPQTEQIVLLNIEGSFFISAVKLLLCVDLLFTYPVVMRPSIQILHQSFIRKNNQNYNCFKNSTMIFTTNNKGKTHTWQDWNSYFFVCAVLGAVAAGAGIFVPAFGLLSGLVGGVSQTFLAFVLPPLMHSKQRVDNAADIDNGKVRSTWKITSLDVKEATLVFLGFALIGWTLSSTWLELTVSN